MDVVPYILLIFILINGCSMFDFHILIAAIVMFNILKLIIKIVYNYPTHNVLV
jgi:hypothetical protein